MEYNRANPCDQNNTAPSGRNLYRLKLESAGCLSVHPELVDRLGLFGVQVLSEIAVLSDQEVRSGQDPAATADRSAGGGNELLLDLTRPIDLPVIEHALRPTGHRVVTLLPAG